MSLTERRFAVVGAGISGLAAAHDLMDHGAVTIYDPDPPGGKIVTGSLDGRGVDLGADAFLTSPGDAVRLCVELAMADELVAPATGAAMILGRRGLEEIPSGLVLGAPRRWSAIRRAPMLNALGVSRAALDYLGLATRPSRDVSVHGLVARRLGRQLAETLVDPLVGGIHAGRADDLSAETNAPQLYAAARRSRSLMRGLAMLPRPTAGATFLAPRAGMGQLVERLVASLRRRGATFAPRAIGALPQGWELRGDRRIRLDEESEPYDGVILAVAAPAALAMLGAAGASQLRGIPSASVAIVLASYDASELSLPSGMSGFLVAEDKRQLLTAASFASAKWPHRFDANSGLVRLSTGRHHDRRPAAMSDNELAERLVAELADALECKIKTRSVLVKRWPEAFPQYLVGHLERIAIARRDLARTAPAVALAGSSYDGSGIPACIASGRRAAAAIACRFGGANCASSTVVSE